MTAVPVVVVAHSAMHPDRTTPLYEHVARVATGAGAACLRYDRRGTGASTGDAAAATPSDLAADVAAAVAAARAHDAIDPARVVLWGHSQGSWLALAVAANDSDIAGLAAISSPGDGPRDQMTYAVRSLLAEAGYPEPDIAGALAAREVVERWAYDEAGDTDVRAVIAATRDEPWHELAFLPDSVDPALKPTRRAWLDFDPVPAIRRLAQPTLLVHGARDRWIDVEASRATWSAEATAADVTSLLLDECGHSPTRADDPTDWAETGPVDPAYDTTLRDWLKRVTA